MNGKCFDIVSKDRHFTILNRCKNTGNNRDGKNKPLPIEKNIWILMV